MNKNEVSTIGTKNCRTCAIFGRPDVKCNGCQEHERGRVTERDIIVAWLKNPRCLTTGRAWVNPAACEIFALAAEAIAGDEHIAEDTR